MPGLGDAFDKLKKAASEHSDKVEDGLRKAGNFAKEKTGGKHDHHIDKATDSASDYLRKQNQNQNRPEGDNPDRQDRPDRPV